MTVSSIIIIIFSFQRLSCYSKTTTTVKQKHQTEQKRFNHFYNGNDMKSMRFWLFTVYYCSTTCNGPEWTEFRSLNDGNYGQIKSGGID